MAIVTATSQALRELILTIVEIESASLTLALKKGLDWQSPGEVCLEAEAV
jgi:hypothetical protein